MSEKRCDDNPGGTHSFGSILDDPELAWGEGYPDYWQAAVRTSIGATDGRFYIDADNMGNNRISLDLEAIPATANPAVKLVLPLMAISTTRRCTFRTTAVACFCHCQRDSQEHVGILSPTHSAG